MPISRKRAKGKERKLKQQARQSVSSSSPPPAVGGNISLLEQNIQRRIVELAGNIKCLHGSFIPPRGHPVNDFIHTFQEGCPLEDHNVYIVDVMSKTFEKHEDVWKCSTLRKMAINIMLCIGTSCLLQDSSVAGARKNSQAIILLENYDGEGTFKSALSKASGDLIYQIRAEERDIVHFYKKRITCSCLNELYSKIKKIQVRGSKCIRCNQITKHIDLKICSRCKCAHYCSRECQKLDWPSHKENCYGICPLHESE